MTERQIIDIFAKQNICVKNIYSALNSYNSSVYIIETTDDKYIFKISNNAKKRECEKKYYNYLYDKVPTSKVIVSDCVDGFDFNIITFFEGENLYDEKANELSEKRLFMIGQLLGNIHSCNILESENDSWITYLEDCLNKTALVVEDIIGKKENENIFNFLQDFINKKIKNNYRNVILHMDFRLGNAIINNDNVGIIDLESMKNGDYVFDFVKMNRILTYENFEIFKSGYNSVREIDDTFDEKLKFYSIFDSYTSLHWCIKKQQTDSAFFKTNYDIISNWLEENNNGTRHI